MVNKKTYADTFAESWNHADQIDGWLTKREGKLLYTLASSFHTTRDVIEIGSYKGKSTILLASALAKHAHGQVIAVDPHKGDITLNAPKFPATLHAFTKTIKDAHVEQYVKLYRMTSIDASKKYHGVTDMLFIDGLHDYDHASEDFHAWFPFVKTGGIIIFHDGYCGIPGVGRATEEVLARNDISSVGTVGSMIYVVKGAPHSWWSAWIYSVRRNLVLAGQNVYRMSAIPKSIRMFFSHRLIKLLLYTQIDRMMGDTV